MGSLGIRASASLISRSPPDAEGYHARRYGTGADTKNEEDIQFMDTRDGSRNNDQL